MQHWNAQCCKFYEVNDKLNDNTCHNFSKKRENQQNNGITRIQCDLVIGWNEESNTVIIVSC